MIFGALFEKKNKKKMSLDSLTFVFFFLLVQKKGEG